VPMLVSSLAILIWATPSRLMATPCEVYTSSMLTSMVSSSSDSTSTRSITGQMKARPALTIR